MGTHQLLPEAQNKHNLSIEHPPAGCMAQSSTLAGCLAVNLCKAAHVSRECTDEHDKWQGGHEQRHTCACPVLVG